jgi:hypothetical protein
MTGYQFQGVAAAQTQKVWGTDHWAGGMDHAEQSKHGGI